MFLFGCVSLTPNKVYKNIEEEHLTLRARIVIETENSFPCADIHDITKSIEYTEKFFCALNLTIRITDVEVLQEAKSIEYYKISDSERNFHTLNIYIVNQPIDIGNKYGGISAFPWYIPSNYIIIHKDSVNGMTLSHEFGHYFGLFHTFEKDDFVKDTYSKQEFADMYGGLSYFLYDNFMNYGCGISPHITEGQLKRMRENIGYRSNIIDNCNNSY